MIKEVKFVFQRGRSSLGQPIAKEHHQPQWQPPTKRRPSSPTKRRRKNDEESRRKSSPEINAEKRRREEARERGSPWRIRAWLGIKKSQHISKLRSSWSNDHGWRECVKLSHMCCTEENLVRTIMTFMHLFHDWSRRVARERNITIRQRNPVVGKDWEYHSRRALGLNSWSWHLVLWSLRNVLDLRTRPRELRVSPCNHEKGKPGFTWNVSACSRFLLQLSCTVQCP